MKNKTNDNEEKENVLNIYKCNNHYTDISNAVSQLLIII